MFQVLGTTDVALRLGCSTERVRQLEREGKLPALKTAGGYRIFRAEDVEAFRIQREQKRAKAQGIGNVK